MKFRNIFWGVILIFIGVLVILSNLHVIHFDWYNLWRLWPVILVLWGVSILPVNSWIKTILTLIVLSGSIYFIMEQTSPWDNRHGRYQWWDDWDSEDKTEIDQFFDVPFEDSADMAVLNLDAAAGAFLINNTTDQLLTFDKKGAWNSYSYLVKKMNGKTEVMIEPEGGSIKIRKGKNRNSINISLNEFPVWEMYMDVGASAMDFDLTPYKIKTLEIDGGAAAFEIVLGDKHEETHVSIDAGASSIELKIPESSGCDLQISSVLSGRDINGFEKVEHGHYKTENFDDAANKIFISVDAAVSSYSITRY